MFEATEPFRTFLVKKKQNTNWKGLGPTGKATTTTEVIVTYTTTCPVTITK